MDIVMQQIRNMDAQLSEIGYATIDLSRNEEVTVAEELQEVGYSIARVARFIDRHQTAISRLYLRINAADVEAAERERAAGIPRTRSMPIGVSLHYAIMLIAHLRGQFKPLRKRFGQTAEISMLLSIQATETPITEDGL
jgi:hypothetical protein